MRYFTLEELTRSDTAQRNGIDNTPSPEVIASLTRLVDTILDPLRDMYGAPIIVNSGYRCPRLNSMVGGSPTSQHMKGEAADITAKDKHDNARLYYLIKQNLPYHQLIWEKGNKSYPDWIHVSILNS